MGYNGNKKNMTIIGCRVCDSTSLEIVVDLGSQPWCNNFLREEELGKEPFYPLRLLFCSVCTATQLDHTVNKEIMFGNHTYLSGITKSLGNHFRRVASEVDQRFLHNAPVKTVLDIGSNDGTQLGHFRTLGYEVLGVESSKTTAQIAMKAGIPTINKFFNLETLREIGKRFDVINAAGVFFHLEELHSVTEAIREGLKEDGIFIVQFLYMKSIVENMAFDQIYHEHLLYYNLKSLDVLLDRHGLELFDAYLDPIHGGSIVGFVTHRGKRSESQRLLKLRRLEEEMGSNCLETYYKFNKRILKMKEDNLQFLEQASREGKRVFGFSAAVKGNTLLNYFGVGTNYIECLVEKNELRRGLYSPGMHIPVFIERDLKEWPDIYYVLVWNFKDEILANNKALIDRGVEFYFPVNPKNN